MGIDYYTCSYCGDTFNDCGHYVSCDCGRHWCSDECAKKDKYRTTKDTCGYCKNEIFEDGDLLKFSLKLLNINKKELIKQYKESK
jgi:hypothetical protein